MRKAARTSEEAGSSEKGRLAMVQVKRSLLHEIRLKALALMLSRHALVFHDLCGGVEDGLFGSPFF